METVYALLAIAVALIVVFRRLKHGFIEGLTLATTLLVALPTALRLELPGALPDLTAHRLILLLLLYFWFRRAPSERVPGFGAFIRPFRIWCLLGCVSLLFTSISFSTSLKRFLDTICEFFLFYLLVSSSIRHEEDALSLLRGIWRGLLVVGLLAFVERYTGFNPVDRFLPSFARTEGTHADVLSTYPHRILLGTAMAMAWPVALALLSSRAGGFRCRGWLTWSSVIVFMGACYFGMSRGPWLAAAIAFVGVIVLCTNALRSRLVWIMVLAIAGMMARPGVAESILGLVGSTTQEGSQKEGTFKYRLELWKIAWNAVSKSPLRTVIGYGPGAGMEMDVEWELSYRGTERKIESWDNHFAYDLLQSGILGLLSTVALVAAPLLGLYRHQRMSHGWRRDALAGIVCAILAFIFMMTNVLIFAKQLHFLFWTLALAGMKIGTPAGDDEEGVWDESGLTDSMDPHSFPEEVLSRRG